MNAVDAQLKAAYEQNGMSPSEISQEFGFDCVAVKAKLMQISSKYRKDAGMEESDEDSLNFSNDQLKQINDQIFNVAIGATLPDGSPDYRTMLKAAEYIRDDKKGRKDIKKFVQNNTFNMLSFNESLQQARVGAGEAKQRLLQQAKKEPIEA